METPPLSPPAERFFAAVEEAQRAYRADATDAEVDADRAALGDSWQYDGDAPLCLLSRTVTTERAERARVARAA